MALPRSRPRTLEIFQATALLGLSVAFAFAPASQARDLLRPGTGGSGPTGKAVAGGANAPGSVAAAQTGKSARDMLARTTQAVQAMRDMQGAARSLAQKSPLLMLNHGGTALPPVPNGLVTGGLQVAPGVPRNLSAPGAGENPALWQGARLPTEVAAEGRTVVTIEQTRQQALLNWQTFNIGRETTVHFDQRAGSKKGGGNDWVAINKVSDPTGVPSQILGSLRAEGSVYLINPNGIIFGGTSQINVHSLAASSLPINDNLLTRGLLNNPDAQFLFSALSMPAGANGTPAFTPPALQTANGRLGDVVVEAGARLTSPTTPDHVGGRIALIGANVINQGSIATPDGQTILAAGLQVGLAAHPSGDATLRGLDVYVGAVAQPAVGGTPAETPYAGTALNAGLIDAFRADVTLAGKSVVQKGVINSSTSVTLNGRIDLLANYDAAPFPQSSGTGGLDHAPFLFRSTGTVTLGADSVSRVVPEYESEETVVGTQLALNSQVKVQGKTVSFGEDATLFAPSATVNIDSGVWRYQGGATPQSLFVYAGGQIHLGSGATINVAGTAGLEAKVTENIISAELRGAELADSPVQRNGQLRGQTVNIDVRQSGVYNGQLWVGSPLFNAIGYIGLIQRPVGELTTAGGTVNLRSGGSVVLQSGSLVDASGGFIDYHGALVQTTRVRSGSTLLDIAQATPDMVYDGFYDGTFTVNHPKYGLSETFTNPLLLNGLHYEAGYVFGGNGGSISIQAPSMALDGTLRGRTVEGPRQRQVAPTLGSLSLAFQAQDVSAGAGSYPVYSPTPPTIVFQSVGCLPAPADFAFDATGAPMEIPDERKRTVYLSPDLLGPEGFGNLRVVNTDGDITLPAGSKIEGAPRGSLTLSAANIDIEGDIVIPGGALSFSAYNISPTLFQQLKVTPGAQTPAPDPQRGLFQLGAGAELKTAGLLVDDRAAGPRPFAETLATSGGTVSIASYSADLQAGSLIDVSGGVAVAPNGRRTYGNGGRIAISTGQDLELLSVLGGHLSLRSELRGFSGARGGALALQAPAVQIGGATAGADTFHVSPQFFNRGGFADFTLTGLDFTWLTPGTVVQPIVTSYLAKPSSEDVDRLELVPFLKPADLRSSASLTLGSPGAFDDFTSVIKVRGDVIVDHGSRIEMGPLGRVALNGQTVLVQGSIYTPGGSISIAGANSSLRIFPEVQDRALVTVDLGPHSVLSAAGTTLLTADPRGFRTGSVLAGGSISVSGNMVAEAGALLDVSGAADTLAFRAAYAQVNAPALGSLAGLPMVAIHVESAGGTIALRGGQELFTNATLRGAAGGNSALGGTVIISSGRFDLPGVLTKPTDVTLEVRQKEITTFAPFGGLAIGQAVRGLDGAVLSQLGRFTVREFQDGGFDSLTLGGTVEFQGPVSIQGRGTVAVADRGVLITDSRVVIEAPHVVLGQPFIAPRPVENQVDPFQTADGQRFAFDPTFGKGSLTVRADLIEIGNLSLQHIGRADLQAAGGEVRGDGTFDIAGTLRIEAGQVYVPTAVNFTIAASDYEAGGTTHRGSVLITGSGPAPVPFSAGGALSIYASHIEQGGTLRAPMGSIQLGWDGTGTAPLDPITGKAYAVAQSIRLRPGSITSVSAIDPATGVGLLIPYGVNLNGTSWIDPRGTDITVDGQPRKSITISGRRIDSQAGSQVDVRGGGDLYAYRFVPGLGGTQDLLASTTSFAVLPGYESAFAPFAPYSDRPLTTNLGTDPGYVNASLSAGDQIYLGASPGLAAGEYTLLPARYALLPGALLVTPRATAPVGTVTMADGASLVTGYRLNKVGGADAPALLAAYEVAPGEVVRLRAEYQDSLGNDFFRAAALARSLPVPRLPQDAGHLILSATQAMALHGRVTAGAPEGAHGGLVDISSPVDIIITNGTTGGTPGALVLNATELSNFGAESLLIGGVRQLGEGVAKVTVNTGNLTVRNAGAPLSAPDLILVAKNNLTVASGSVLEQSGAVQGGADLLQIGSSTVAGSGDGALIRVGSDPSARIVRAGVSSSTVPHLEIGVGARLTGASLLLDSTFATTLAPSALLQGSAVTLNSGQVSVLLGDYTGTPTTDGLVLSGAALQSLQASARSLSLLSYSTLDFYGSGQVGSPAFARLALHAGEIRSFASSGGTVTLAAQQVSLDNSATAPSSAPFAAALGGTLQVTASNIRLGAHTLRIDNFAEVKLGASSGLRFQGTGGLNVAGNLTMRAPAITAAQVANQQVTSAGLLRIESTGTAPVRSQASGLGASLSFTGAGLVDNGVISLPSGQLTLRALTGDLVIGGRVDVSGTAQSFYDVVRYTNGGRITLQAEAGSVTLQAESRVDVSAAPGGGNAGALLISSPLGTLRIAGTVAGQAGAQGEGGTFLLDAGQIESGSLAELNGLLDTGGFDVRRDFRVRTGDVLLDGSAKVANFGLSTDTGSIRVTGSIDAAGAHGGSIALVAGNGLRVESTARLTVAGVARNSAGQGGSILLETRQGQLQLAAGSELDLSVGGATGGTLHLRAPQTAGASSVAIDPIAGTILNASSIVAEGFFVQDAQQAGTAALENFQATALANATSFMTHEAAIRSTLLGSQGNLADVLHLRPGEEIVNSLGGLSLSSDWDLSTWRFGTQKGVLTPSGPLSVGVEPGVLTLRARDSITLLGSISDGFGTGAGEVDMPLDVNGELAPWKQTLLPLFTDGTAQASWSYRITAGADLTAADFHRVQAGSTGSVLLGRDAGVAISNPFGANASVDTAIHPAGEESRYQVIRTGAGGIQIAAAGDVKLLNQFATIYSAGALIPDQTLGGTFDVPRLYKDPDGAEPLYPAQYSAGGGDVLIAAGGSIAHETMLGGQLVPDAVRQLPVNWLYRRGFVDPVTGEFGQALFGDVASTSWWVDFSNFFQGVGALGGGNVSLIAGLDISNVDAVIPTNARLPKISALATDLVELGGGDLHVEAGRDVDAGVYYVERGTGTITAGNTIHTNGERSPNLGRITGSTPSAPETWLPTTLFAGRATFDVSARGDLLLGPVANPFLLPSGAGNSVWYKTYYSTYGPESAVSVSSLAGSVTLRESTTLPTAGIGATTPLLLAWLQNELLFTLSADSAAYYQPWLRLAETSVNAFRTASTILPGTLRATAFSGDVNVVGNMTLSPAARGTLELLAAGALNGLQPTGVSNINGVNTRNWAAATINLSDADPARVPGLLTPFAYQSIVGLDTLRASRTENDFLANVDGLFSESGSTQGLYGVLQKKQQLHSTDLLHADDDQPVRLLSRGSDISGLTLFAGKAASVIAGRDLTDIALYVQNTQAEDTTVVAAGRDIIAYNPNSPLRVAARAPGNVLNLGNNTLAGDIQISGPGLLEVLAGRDLDLGVGPNNVDGTGVGIVSIGNARNPALPFEGSAIIAAAGVGPSSSLATNANFDLEGFLKYLAQSPEGTRYLAEAANEGAVLTPQEIALLPHEEQASLAVRVFFLALRDAGRDHNSIVSPAFGTYEGGAAAIAALFPQTYRGDISLTSREIKTKSGGDISLLAPGGQLLVGFDIGGNQALDQGILTEDGGNISIFTKGSVVVGTSRIFTLRGGSEIIWSSTGDIAAGASSKTVQSAPPTRVLVDPQSADVQTDLAGLATGGGIGVLATVAGVAAGDIDLIAPAGTIDAGDAGIRVSGNLNLAAVQVLNASNIAVGGSSAGAPSAPAVAAPSLGGISAASSTAGAAASAATEVAQQNRPQPTTEEAPSIISVDVSVSAESGAAATAEQAREEEERRRRATTPAP